MTQVIQISAITNSIYGICINITLWRVFQKCNYNLTMKKEKCTWANSLIECTMKGRDIPAWDAAPQRAQFHSRFWYAFCTVDTWRRNRILNFRNISWACSLVVPLTAESRIQGSMTWCTAVYRHIFTYTGLVCITLS